MDDTGIATWLIAGSGSLASLMWVGVAILMRWHRKKRVWLAEVEEASDDDLPDLAVLIAARDEAANIRAALQSVLDQDYPDLTIIVANDRSSDDTGAILQALSLEYPCLRTVQIDQLPDGWLGKTHALEVAAASTSATWLLFTDADVCFAPRTLRRSVRWALEHKLDHLTVVPEFITKTIAERVFLLFFGLGFSVRVFTGKVESPGRKGHLGIGAFNLVRAESLRAIGGLESIKLSVDDDNRIAQALKAGGANAGALCGAGAVSVYWQTGVSGLIAGMEKNYFAIFDYRIGLVALSGVAWLFLGVAPYAGLLVGPLVSRAVCAMGVCAIASLLAIARKQTGIGWYYAALLPVSVLLHLYALLRSTYRTLSLGGVTWRSSHYALGELRSHVRQRNAWIKCMFSQSGE